MCHLATICIWPCPGDFNWLTDRLKSKQPVYLSVCRLLSSHLTSNNPITPFPPFIFPPKTTFCSIFISPNFTKNNSPHPPPPLQIICQPAQLGCWPTHCPRRPVGAAVGRRGQANRRTCCSGWPGDDPSSWNWERDQRARENQAKLPG